MKHKIIISILIILVVLTTVNISGTVKALKGVNSWKLEYAVDEVEKTDGEITGWMTLKKWDSPNGTVPFFEGESLLFSWDTTVLADGTYRLRLSVTDKDNTTETTTMRVRVNNVETENVVATLPAEYVIPSSEPIPIKFTLNDDAYVKIEIIPQNNSGTVPIATLADNYVYPKGENTVYWWGTADDGSWATGGNYRVSLTPTDVSKTVGSTVASANLVVRYPLSEEEMVNAPVELNAFTSQKITALQWKQGTTGNNPISNYKIYRSEDNLNWGQIGEKTGTVPEGTAPVFSYIDADATKVIGKTYYYKITAIDTVGTESKSSNIV